MADFKKGDTVERFQGGDCTYCKIGKPYKVETDTVPGNSSIRIIGEDDFPHEYDKDNYRLVNNSSNMSIKQKFISLFLSEPEKSFRKAGVTNGDGILTSEGQEVFLTWMLKKHGDEFKTEVIDPILAEEEKDK